MYAMSHTHAIRPGRSYHAFRTIVLVDWEPRSLVSPLWRYRRVRACSNSRVPSDALLLVVPMRHPCHPTLRRTNVSAAPTQSSRTSLKGLRTGPFPCNPTRSRSQNNDDRAIRDNSFPDVEAIRARVVAEERGARQPRPSMRCSTRQSNVD